MKIQPSKILTFAVMVGLTIATGCSTQKTACNPQLGPPITVFGAPVASHGTQGTCPGSYAGYVIYTKTIAQGWGWAPSTNVTVFTAADGGGRSDTKITYSGKGGDFGCNPTNVTIPNPPLSTKYRFAIYFPGNVPTTNYPIVLTGFNP